MWAISAFSPLGLRKWTLNKWQSEKGETRRTRRRCWQTGNEGGEYFSSARPSSVTTGEEESRLMVSRRIISHCQTTVSSNSPWRRRRVYGGDGGRRVQLAGSSTVGSVLSGTNKESCNKSYDQIQPVRVIDLNFLRTFKRRRSISNGSEITSIYVTAVVKDVRPSWGYTSNSQKTNKCLAQEVELFPRRQNSCWESKVSHGGEVKRWQWGRTGRTGLLYTEGSANKEGQNSSGSRNDFSRPSWSGAEKHSWTSASKTRNPPAE